MCRGDRLIADFVAGTDARPGLPEVVGEHLTPTADGLWVVWAYKLARQQGDRFVPLTGPPGYPADAKARCRSRGGRRTHDAPDPRCTCGFHALSSRNLPGLPVHHGFSMLTVALSGRVLAFEWPGDGVLWRAERQTVVRIEQPTQSHWMEDEFPALVGRTPAVPAITVLRRPDDPGGRTAAVRPRPPRDSGLIRLNLPASCPVVDVCHDDAGWCLETSTFEHRPASLVLV